MDPFVSYAQNYEDVMLWRALRHVERGFYVDAGAAEPELDSVTYAFYQRGWHGINIEPSAVSFARLDAARPRDVNLNIAAGANNGEADMLLVDGGGGLSTLRTCRQATLQSEGHGLERKTVTVRRLADLFREHAPEHIHFLKIDVEGAERDVIEGAELDTWRPWIIVAEATEPKTPKSAYADWEPLLLAARYRMAYADGLNRFYLAEEHEALASAFATPPNVFDGFIRREEWQAKQDADTLYKQVMGLDAALAQASAGAAAISQRAEQLAAERDLVVQERDLALQERDLALEDRDRVVQERELVVQERDLTLQERDHAMQELWESNRLAGVLTGVRQTLTDAVTAAREAEAETRRLLSVTHDSTSWRVTAPLRSLKRISSGR